MLTQFVSAIMSEQRLTVPPPQPISGEDRVSATTLLVRMEQIVRQQTADEPPSFDPTVAVSAAETLLAACQLLVYRDLDAKLPAILRDNRQVKQKTASDHYSADIVLRFLPDVIRLAASAAKDDPLVTDLTDLANEWPLSAVGVSGADDWDPALEHPSLLMTFVDRVIQRNDVVRLRVPAVARAVRGVIGEFGALAPNMKRALEANT